MPVELETGGADRLRTFLKRWFLWQVVFVVLQVGFFNAVGDVPPEVIRRFLKFVYGPSVTFIGGVLNISQANRELVFVILALIYAVPAGALAAVVHLKLRRGSKGG